MSVSCYAQVLPQPSKEECLQCHGPSFDDLINKNVRVESESGFVNPHSYIPHGDRKGEVTECTNCHRTHSFPVEKGYKDETATLEPCYSCHHNYELKKCSSCHDK